MRLKHCPFCASPEINDIWETESFIKEGKEFHRWVCPRCDAKGPADSTPGEASTKWNHRLVPTEYPKIIFLDIDGVLNCEIAYVDRHEGREHDLIETESGEVSKRCVNLLNELTDDTNAKIVVSSTWRRDGLEKISASLKSAGVTGEIIGVTGNGKAGTVRGNEIYTWIEENPEIVGTCYEYKSFIILDDDSDMLLWQKNHFFQVDPYCGLTRNLVYRAKNFLNRN